jgi:hypothetical protein
MTMQDIKNNFDKSKASGPPMRWFRMYSEFATDPKVQMLSESDQRRYLMLLCLRCCNGDVTLQDAECAFQLRISETDYATTKAVLVARGLIDEANHPTAWDRRQYVSDTSKQRVSKHREKKKQAPQPACNVTVTPPESETDTELEAEKKKELCAVLPFRATTRRDCSTEEIDFRFEEFWAAFPKGRKKGKGKAKALFRQIARGGHHSLKASAETLISAAKAYAAVAPDPQFTPMPQTWLAGGRWEDDLEQIAAQAKPTFAKTSRTLDAIARRSAAMEAMQ